MGGKREKSMQGLVNYQSNIEFHLAGRKWSFVKGKVWNDYPSIQLTAWKVSDSCCACLIWSLICATGIAYLTSFAYKLQFWPIVSWVNYQYVPLQLRVLFPSFFACCWLAPLLQLWPSKAIYSSLPDSLPVLINLHDKIHCKSCIEIAGIWMSDT